MKPATKAIKDTLVNVTETITAIRTRCEKKAFLQEDVISYVYDLIEPIKRKKDHEAVLGVVASLPETLKLIQIRCKKKEALKRDLCKLVVDLVKPLTRMTEEK